MDIFDSKYPADILDITIPALQVQTGTFVQGSYKGGRRKPSTKEETQLYVLYIYMDMYGKNL